MTKTNRSKMTYNGTPEEFSEFLSSLGIPHIMTAKYDGRYRYDANNTGEVVYLDVNSGRVWTQRDTDFALYQRISDELLGDGTGEKPHD